MIRLFLVSLSFLVLSLAHANTAGHSNSPTPLTPDAEGELLSLEGSNTVGARLAGAWAEGYLAAKGAEKITTRTGAKPNEYEVIGIHRGRRVWVSIKAHGSSTGFEGLALGSADLAMSSRPINSRELAALAHFGDLASSEGEHVVAIDGLAIITHPDNPLSSLSVAQVQALFSGAVRNWREVGGRDAPVELYARDDNSGTFDTFKTLVLANKPLASSARRFESNDMLSSNVAIDPNGIGFVGLAAVGEARAFAINDGAALPMVPGRLPVATEDYPLARRLYLYSPVTVVDPIAREFVRYTQSEAGQQAVDAVGYVAQTPVVTPHAVTDGPRFYLELARIAERLTVNFRFQPGRAELDSKARRDVERLAHYMQANSGARLQLVGFSDGVNDEDSTAKILSKLRASRVKIELSKLGIKTAPIAGFGAARKVADTSLRNARNDRVEVWVYQDTDASIINALHTPSTGVGNVLAIW